MSASSAQQDAIDRIVSEVLEEALPGLRARLAERLSRELSGAAPPLGDGAPAAPTSALLYAALASVQDAASQSDILEALLTGSQSFCGRSALLVVKRDAVRAWRARGFDGDSLRDFSLDPAQPLLRRALESGQPAAAAAADMGGKFVDAAGIPADGNALLLPLVVNHKVAALLYADGGDGARLDASALQLLARATAAWIELVGLRKSGAAPTAEEAHAEPAAEAEPPAAAEPPAPEPAAREESAPQAAAPASAASNPEVHRKAQRFAKLLVDEIRLYNKEKVEQGRQSKDLYDRLREDIEKSRATYEKRFGKSEAGPSDYFNQELVRILADNDPSLLGSSFQQ